MRRLFYLIVTLQILFLLAEIASYETAIGRALKHGKVIALKVVPVDPRSLFMGNYMDLSYDISRIDLAKVPHDAALDKSPEYEAFPVYVWLRPQAPWAVIVKVTTDPPRDPQALYLRGSGYRSSDGLAVDYGLERYYIPETASEKVERLTRAWGTRAPQISVEVVVTGKGKGLIHRVLANGKPLEF